MVKILPKKKREILAYLERYIDEHGYAPTLKDIAEYFGVSSTATIHEHLEYLEKNRFIKRNGRNIVIGSRQRKKPTLIPSFTEESHVEGSVYPLPIVGLITAGEPIEAIQDVTETLSVPAEIAKRPDSYVLKVKGDSMIESLIDDGDYVVVQKQEYASDGDIVVALLDNGTATLKEYHKEKHYVRLQPRNPQYPPIHVKNIVIQGKVVGIMRKF